MATRKALVAALRALDALDQGESLRKAVSGSLQLAPDLGPKERRFVSASAREVTQQRRWLDALLAQAGIERRTLIPEDLSLLRLFALRLRVHEVPVEQALRELALPGPRRPRGVGDDVLQALATKLPTQLTLPSQRPAALALRYSFPDWLTTLLLPSLPEGEAEAWFEATARAPSLDLRVNLAVATPAAAAEELKAAGLQIAPGRFLPEAVVCEDRALLFDTAAFKKGRVEVQDEASQLIARLCGVRSGQKVLDACAGAGGKALALAGLEPSASITAFDADRSRLHPLRNRARRAGAKIVVMEGVPSTWYDVVLVDAPCSGLGALSKEPDAKWRLEPTGVAKLAALQLEILKRYAARVRPGGRLIYATCSPLLEEDERVVEAFLSSTPGYTLAAPAETLGDDLAAKLGASRVLRTWSHRHGTGSFFAASMRRVE